jgi:hypothetical protein
MSKIFVVVMLVVMLVFAAGCTAADTASYNISKAAVFYNGITGEYILQIEGLCSIGNSDAIGEVSITCKVSPTEYKKHYLGLSDNVTYFAEQIDGAETSIYHYRVIFRPSEIVPDIDVQLP